jgi:hypothetical protein
MTDLHLPESEKTSSGLHLTRRKALVGAAWTVPAITVATAAPAFAASNVFEWTVDDPTFYRMASADGSSLTGTGQTTGNFAKFILNPRSVDADGALSASYVLTLTVKTATGSNGAALLQGSSSFGAWSQSSGPTDSTSAATSYTFTTTLSSAAGSAAPITLVFGNASTAAGWGNGDSVTGSSNATATVTTTAGTNHATAVMTVSGKVTDAAISAPAYS